MTTDYNEEGTEVPASSIIVPDDQSSDPAESQTAEEKERDSRFKEGQILRFVRVRFPGNSRSFPFLVGKRAVEYGQKVVALSDRGMAVGYVNSFPYDVPFNKSMLPIRSISKVAENDDIDKDKEAYRQQKNAENICNDLIEQHKLDMHLTHVEFTSFGKKAVFYFIAPSRVDFRDLVRDLVYKLKTRIELRQISVRDRSASVGGIGPCGRELCCSSFLTKYGNVGIKMAKNQDLTLNFSKLNGVCGQLKCCLQYEDDVYREKRAKLPKEGDIILTHTGEKARVDRLHLLSEQFEVLTDRGIRKRYVMEMYKETLNKEEANFPKEFESVSSELQKVVGLDEKKTKTVMVFEEEIKTHKEKSKSFAENIFEGLFGEKSLGYDLPDVAELEQLNKKKIVVPDDEEEIEYTPSEEDMLLDDEDDDYQLEEVIPVSVGVREKGQDRGPQRGQNDNRGSSGDGNRNRDGRQQDRSHQGRDHRGNQNRGPRNDRPRDDRPRSPNQQQNNNRDGSQGDGSRNQGNRQPNNRGPNDNRNNQNRGSGPRR